MELVKERIQKCDSIVCGTKQMEENGTQKKERKRNLEQTKDEEEDNISKMKTAQKASMKNEKLNYFINNKNSKKGD